MVLPKPKEQDLGQHPLVAPSNAKTPYLDQNPSELSDGGYGQCHHEKQDSA